IEVLVMDVKAEDEKIVLSLKHTEPDPLSTMRIGQSVHGRVVRSGESGLTLELASGVEAQIRQSELSEDSLGRVQVPAIGEDVSAKVIRLDARERRVDLSVRKHDREEERQMLKRYAGQNQQPLTLGDVLVETDDKTGEEERK